MKFNICYLLIAMMWIGAPSKSNAQIRKPSIYSEINIQSPTAAALGKYVDLPVSNYTGTPDISIPIYTVKEGPLSLPISINYHASGIKVMEPASWIGTGWSLNAGGVITRTVRGIADEGINAQNGVNGHFKHYGYSNFLTDGGSVGYPTMPPNKAGPYDYGFKIGSYDGEPDLYFFNFAGFTGSFYFRDDRTPIFEGGQDLKIEYNFPSDNHPSYTGFSANIQGFIITTPDGTRYYFGINASGSMTGADPIEWTFPYSASHQNVSDNIFSSWYLNKIESADKTFEINLTYTAESFSYFSIAMFPIDGETSVNSPTKPYELVKNYIMGVRLKSIEFSNGFVSFIPSSSARIDLSEGFNNAVYASDNINTEAKALGSIKITDNTSFCKKFLFTTSYFIDNTSPSISQLGNTYAIQTDRKRLRLDALQESSCNNSVSLPEYKFQYYGSNDFLSRRLTFAQDHWGFYNGKTTNSSSSQIIPTFFINGDNVIEGANREASWPDMQYGALNKITYPTGGYTSFEFEPHTTYINTTINNSTLKYSESVLGSGSGENTVSPREFSANLYQLVTVNPSCSNASNDCNASAWLTNLSTGAITYVVSGVPGGTTEVSTFSVPSGNYSISMKRNNPQINDYAQATFTFTEITSTQIQENKIVGGLRIKAIRKYDGLFGTNPVPILTTFDYNVNGISQGVLYSRPSYVQKIRNDILAQHGYPGSISTTVPEINGCLGPYYKNANFELNKQLYFKSPCPIVPMETSQGSHIGYSQVKVSQPGNGYSTYEYYVPQNYSVIQTDVSYKNIVPEGCDINIPNLPAAPLPFDFTRGRLKLERHNKEINNGGNITYSQINEIYYYYNYDSDKLVTPAYISRDELGASLTTRYELKSYYLTQTKTIENYTANGISLSKTNINDYTSPYHHEVTSQSFIDSKELVSKLNTKYAFDFRITSCDNLSDGSPTLTTKINACITARNTAMASATTQGQGFIAMEDSFVCAATARKEFAIYRKNTFTGPNNTFQNNHNTAKNGADLDLKPILEMQDDYINAPIEVSTWKNNKLLSSQFNKYKNYGTNPQLNKIQKINLSAPAVSLTSAAVNTGSNGLTKDDLYKDESTIIYNNGNITEVDPNSGLNTAFVWDYYNNLPVAKLVYGGNFNNNYTNYAYTSFESNGTGNWTFTPKILDDKTAPTGNKVHNISNNPISASNLISDSSYIVSYWSRNATPFTVTGSAGTVGAIINKWHYFEHKVSGRTSFTISNNSGANGKIDELRLYPVGAQMTTFTYIPLIGITSQSDMNNKITYYDYDNLGRLINVRDQDRNVLTKYCYNYTGQRAKCATYYNTERIGTFAKNDCTITDYSGSEVTDTVYAGTYSSDSSQAQADSLAAADIRTNGQAFANLSGLCLPMLNIIMANYEHIAGFTIKLTSTYDSTKTYTVAIPSTSDTSISLQKIPQGRYDITVYKPDNAISFIFTVSGPNGDIRINSDRANWVNVPVTIDMFNKISISSQ